MMTSIGSRMNYCHMPDSTDNRRTPLPQKKYSSYILLSSSLSTNTRLISSSLPLSPPISSFLHPPASLSRTSFIMSVQSKFLSSEQILLGSPYHDMEPDDDASFSPLPPQRPRVVYTGYAPDISRPSDTVSAHHNSRLSGSRSGSTSGAHGSQRHTGASGSRQPAYISISSDDPETEAREAELAMLRDENKKLKKDRTRLQGQIGTLSYVLFTLLIAQITY
jgi:hypothetical protein